jgi:hypothetical protein
MVENARRRWAWVGVGMLALVAPAAGWDVGVTTQSGQWTIYNRTANASRLGFPLAAGDLNGDGNDDLVLTPMNADSGPHRERDSAGEATILLGTGTISGERDLAQLMPPALPADTTLIYGADLVDNLGTELAIADLDHDGYDDAIIGAQYGDGPENSRPNCGEVAIVWGSPAIGGQVIDLAAPAPGAVTFVYGAHAGAGSDAGDRLGVWVSSTDFDGDGIADAILGADLADGPDGTRSNAGATYVLYGGAALRARAAIDLAAPDVPLTKIYGIDRGDQSGATVRGADVDRDGIGDVLIGAGVNRLSAQSDPLGGLSGHGFAGGDGPNNACDPVGLDCQIGEVYILFGARGARPSTIDLATPPADFTVIYGVDAGDVWGEEIFAGDFDGDGRGDVVLGALVADGLNNSRATAGEAALIRGDAQRLRGEVIELAAAPANVTRIYGAAASAIAGDTALFLDLDGDGRDELVVASPQQAVGGRVAAGRVIVLFGNEVPPPVIDLAAVPEEVPHLWIDGAHDGDLLAYSMSLGDVNGDGLRDLIVNAMGADGFNDLLPLAGDCYVLDAVALSAAAGRDIVPTRTPTPSPSVTPTPTVTTAPACVGDCNGDGVVMINELIIGVGIVLESTPLASCAAVDPNGDGAVAINELVAAVNAALTGC